MMYACCASQVDQWNQAHPGDTLDVLSLKNKAPPKKKAVDIRSMFGARPAEKKAAVVEACRFENGETIKTMEKTIADIKAYKAKMLGTDSSAKDSSSTKDSATSAPGGWSKPTDKESTKFDPKDPLKGMQGVSEADKKNLMVALQPLIDAEKIKRKAHPAAVPDGAIWELEEQVKAIKAMDKEWNRLRSK